VSYDITIWEEIRSAVRWKRDGLLENINKEITKDISPAEFHSKQPVPWQLREIMEQRANSWVQRLYELCCEARKGTGKEVSVDFDRAIWAYCIEPFIVGEKRIGFDYKVSLLLDLLFCAVGSPPEKRESRKVSQVECCLDVRGKVSEKWYYKLHHLPSRMEEAPAAMARFNAREVTAKRIVTGLPPEPFPAPTPGPPVVAPARVPPTIAKAHRINLATWDSVEISFLSDERVQIRNDKNLETLNFAEFGFVDGRNGKPNEAWILLRALANQRGMIRTPTKSGQSWHKVEKRIQDIRKVFREHFGIAADPIPFVAKVGYRACFKIGYAPSFPT
jgi:hypothetical protein